MELFIKLTVEEKQLIANALKVYGNYLTEQLELGIDRPANEVGRIVRETLTLTDELYLEFMKG